MTSRGRWRDGGEAATRGAPQGGAARHGARGWTPPGQPELQSPAPPGKEFAFCFKRIKEGFRWARQ